MHRWGESEIERWTMEKRGEGEIDGEEVRKREGKSKAERREARVRAIPPPPITSKLTSVNVGLYDL